MHNMKLLLDLYIHVQLLLLLYMYRGESGCFTGIYMYVHVPFL